MIRAFFTTYVIIGIITLIGWIANLVQLVNGPSVLKDPSNVTIVKVIGVPVPPIGVIMGIIGLF
jgi:hypothetical protein